MKGVRNGKEETWQSESYAIGNFKIRQKEFRGLTKEQYQKAAVKLLAEPTSESILGYETEYRRVRYDLQNNIYALGNPKTNKITTMFNPDSEKEYFDGELSKDMGDCYIVQYVVMM